MLSEFWNWLGSLPQGAASFLGTLTGSSIGLLALLGGALFNARLNRQRDDRLRGEDAQGIKSAVGAELAGISKALKLNAKSLDEPSSTSHFFGPDISHQVRVMPVLLPKLVLLETELIEEMIGIYVVIDQYCESLLMLGGTLAKEMRDDRRIISMETRRAGTVAILNRDLAAKIDQVIAKLEIPKADVTVLTEKQTAPVVAPVVQE